MKPVIGVSAQTTVAFSDYYGEQRLTSLLDLYVAAIRTAGGLPVVIGHGRPEEADTLLDRFDGLVLPGGGDIAPEAYGEDPASDRIYGVRPESDHFEFALTRQAALRRLPILGICRGLQVINVAMGGSLHQHLPYHGKDLAGRAFAGHYRTEIVAGSRLHRLAGSTEIIVNSLHHQAVKEVGAGLVVAARAGDGVVEALEATDPHWDMLAVQWHPECLHTCHARAIFDWMVQAARQYAASPTRIGVPAARAAGKCSREPVARAEPRDVGEFGRPIVRH